MDVTEEQAMCARYSFPSIAQTTTFSAAGNFAQTVRGGKLYIQFTMHQFLGTCSITKDRSLRQGRSTQLKQKAVKSFRVLHKEETTLPNGDSFYEDCNPEWTLGNIRPLYIERRAQCLTCRKLSQHSGRFVPVNPNVPSICKRVLSNLAEYFEYFGSLDSDVIAVLLDHWPPSGKKFRSLGRQRKREDEK